MPERCKDDILDEIALAKLNTLDELLKTTAMLSEFMKDGFYQLSTARKFLGQHSVSALRIPETEYEAQYKVTTEAIVNEECEIKYEDLIPTKTKVPSTSDGEVKKPNPNPIKWFSALPPPSLRQAQTHFDSSIRLAARRASLQAQLRALDDKYLELTNQ